MPRPTFLLPRNLAPLVATLLAACATHEPLPRPDAGIPSVWRAPTPDRPDAATDAAAVAWEAYFTDPRLQALIRAALDNNRDLRIAAGKVEQARAESKSARADLFPTLNAQADASHTSTPQAFDTGASNQRFDLQAVLSYEVDFWGRVAAMSDSAKASFLATEEARREVRLALIGQVAGAYYALLEKDELLDLARTNLELREQSLDLVIQGRNIGGADDDERLQADAALESARSAVAQLDHQRVLASNQLDVLVGRVVTDLPPGRPLADQQPGVTLAAGVPSEVLLHRPDVMAAEQRLAAASADIDAARAAFLPKVMLTAALGFASPALATLFSGGAWSYQPVVTAPLFDGGRTAANADSARARRGIVVAEYEKTVQQAFREVADQLSARRSARLQLDSALATQQSYAARLKAARARYEFGATSYRDVLEAHRQLLAARQTTVSLQRSSQDAAAGLYKALGGGADVDRPAPELADSGPRPFPFVRF